jgi:parvulin-like peptidyl-prolyl isomerase
MVTLKRVLSLLLLLTLTACSLGAPNFPAIFASPTPIPPTATPLPPTATPIPLAININGEGLTTEELNAELARYKSAMTALGKTVTDEQALQSVRDDTIAQFLLAQGAAEAGFILDAAALQQRLDALASKLGGADKLTTWEQAHGYTDESFKTSLKRAAASAWMRDKIMSAVPSTADQVHVRQILLYNEDVAKSYYNQLQAGANFEELATQVDPITHGDIGWFPRGYLSEKTVEDAAFSLTVGAYSAIVPSEVGFHIFLLLDHQSGRELSPDALSVLQAHALNDWLAARRQQSSIVLTP